MVQFLDRPVFLLQPLPEFAGATFTEAFVNMAAILVVYVEEGDGLVTAETRGYLAGKPDHARPIFRRGQAVPLSRPES